MTGGRSQGWPGIVALVVATMGLSVIQPALLIFVPFALLLVGLPPRRPALVGLALLIGLLAFTRPPSVHALWNFERGWALLLGAWFVVLSAAVPEWRFLSRALGTIAASAVSAGVFLATGGTGFGPLDQAVGDRIRGGITEILTATAGGAGFQRVGEQAQELMYRMADVQAELYPALLGLASLAALGLAWWAYARLARGEQQPLGRLREFRFRDELVWLLVAGVVLLALPLGAIATRTGENLLLFMAALYAVRGLAVVVMVSGVPGPLGLLLGGLILLVMYPLVMATAFLVGLSDTWLDIRARRQVPSSPGS